MHASPRWANVPWICRSLGVVWRQTPRSQLTIGPSWLGLLPTGLPQTAAEHDLGIADCPGVRNCSGCDAKWVEPGVPSCCIFQAAEKCAAVRLITADVLPCASLTRRQRLEEFSSSATHSAFRQPEPVQCGTAQGPGHAACKPVPDAGLPCRSTAGAVLSRTLVEPMPC